MCLVYVRISVCLVSASVSLCVCLSECVRVVEVLGRGVARRKLNSARTPNGAETGVRTCTYVTYVSFYSATRHLPPPCILVIGLARVWLACLLKVRVEDTSILGLEYRDTSIPELSVQDTSIKN